MRIGNSVSSIRSWDPREVEKEKLIRRIMRLMTLARMNGDGRAINSLQRAEVMTLVGNLHQAENVVNELERIIIRGGPSIGLNNSNGNSGNEKEDANLPNQLGQDKSRITLVDKSNDPSVSFKYPASVPADSSLLFIASHERQHVQSIVGDAVLKGKIARVYVRYFTSYDYRGRLVFAGGLTWGEILDERR